MNMGIKDSFREMEVFLKLNLLLLLSIKSVVFWHHYSAFCLWTISLLWFEAEICVVYLWSLSIKKLCLISHFTIFFNYFAKFLRILILTVNTQNLLQTQTLRHGPINQNNICINSLILNNSLQTYNNTLNVNI